MRCCNPGPGKSPAAWNACRANTTTKPWSAHVNGGAGGTWQLRDDMLGFALGTVRVEHNNDFNEAISPAAGFNTGVLWKNPLGNLSLEAKGDLLHQWRSAAQHQPQPTVGTVP